MELGNSAFSAHQHLYCSLYNALNDPTEGFYGPSRRLLAHPSYASIEHKLGFRKERIGICCFTDAPDNELMRTHYASNYAGICVSYSSDKLLAGLPGEARLARLGYGSEPPRLSSGDVDETRDAAIKILSHKKASWAYEREWRILTVPGLLTISQQRCIREVRLGSRIHSNHEQRIVRELAGSSIRVVKMTVDGYKHRWQTVRSADRRR
jgi:hypothetical protein